MNPNLESAASNQWNPELEQSRARISQPPGCGTLSGSGIAAIPAAHDKLSNSISRLFKKISELENRIVPVLRVEPATPQCPTSICNPPPTVTMSGKILESADSICEVSNRIENILRLLEL